LKRLSYWAFGGLVAATVAAFFVTQHLKVTTPVIGANVTIPAPLSPGQPKCSVTHTSFYLQHRSDDVDVYVVDQSGSIVRTIAVNHHMRKGVRFPDGASFVWNGRKDDGQLAPDGTYYFRVGLRQQGRTVDLTDNRRTRIPILVKTVAPHPVVKGIDNQLLPHAGVPATIHYSGNEGHIATVDVYRTDLEPAKPRKVFSFLSGGQTALWDGKIRGTPAPPGVYLIGLDVTDRACNTGHFPPIIPPTPGATPDAGVTVRYLAAQPPLDPVPAGTKATVLVDSRLQPYEWALRRLGASRPTVATGKAAGTNPALVVPIPRGAAGLYELAIRSGAYRTEVPIVARASRPSHGGILVVLPALTWQGQNPGDEDKDGMPDTLDAGRAVQLQRPLANGLPAGFGDEAAFLAYLDQAHLPYDLTTDLGVADGSGPDFTSHTGVVLPGDERWVPSSVAAGLKTYVQRGGRVLTLGIDSLRRTADVQGTLAQNPTAPRQTDVLGAQVGDVVTHTSQRILVIRDDLGVLPSSGVFQGFGSYEPVAPVVQGGQQAPSAAGTSPTTPAVIGYRLGGGIVVHVGLPGFGSGLAHNIDAQEFIRRMWTILSR
jgi:hypothetical protein